MNLTNAVAVVTGGGTGIGLATALGFARAGAAVVVNYSRSTEAANRAVKQIEDLGRRALAIRADVSRDDEVRAMMDRVAKELGGIDYLVNNAGWSKPVQPHRDMDALTDEIWDRVWAVNVRGAFYAVRAAVPHMERRGGASVVNVSSVAAFSGTGSSMAYAASKSALIALTKSLARSLAPKIRVNAVAPGLIATGFGGWTEAQCQATAKVTPTRRLPSVEETAEAILYLASSTALTGQTIVVDGGLLGLGPLP
ncbi:MAG: SDR family NAD(P)-dependent oxidoreductase [Candidatus Methylomirabilia bacterium]